MTRAHNDSAGAPADVRNLRIGVDVGGTFTDLFMLDEATGRSTRHKLPSTPRDPYQAPIQGLREIIGMVGATPAQVRFVGLGTTVATNALLERKGALTGLITTKGFRDLLEIGRQTRPHVYDYRAHKPTPLVSRELRLEVEERVAADGSIITQLNEKDVHTALERLAAAGVKSIAVCFLNSYANPKHEARVSQIAREICPDTFVTTSQELIPELREYERLTATVINAYLAPTMKAYLSRFAEEVRNLGISETPFVMSSSGGVVTPELAINRPIDLLLSGPGGGVSAALYIARTSGHRNLITFDMGGTSTDVCLIQDERADVSHVRNIAGYPIRSTTMDIHTVGAGGSSIAGIDPGGMLRVGPHSAGANPGPACYGREGARPTVTDAHVVLGRLNQEYLLAGALKIDAARSHAAIASEVASIKGISVQDAAVAIFEVSNMNIAQAIRFVSVERGLDPSDFMLLSFGGAGGLHAAAVARELNMAVLVPPTPGVLCAMGVLTKNIQLDMSQSRPVRAESADSIAPIAAIFRDLERRARDTLENNGIDTAGLLIERTVDARYVGQNFELIAQVASGPVTDATMAAIRADFDASHQRLYGYAQPEKLLELVTFRIKAVVPVPQPKFQEARGAKSDVPVPSGTRRAYFETCNAFLECPIFERASLLPGSRLRGPAIVEQMDATTVIPPDFDANTDDWGNLILRPLAKGASS